MDVNLVFPPVGLPQASAPVLPSASRPASTQAGNTPFKCPTPQQKVLGKGPEQGSGIWSQVSGRPIAIKFPGSAPAIFVENNYSPNTIHVKRGTPAAVWVWKDGTWQQGMCKVSRDPGEVKIARILS